MYYTIMSYSFNCYISDSQSPDKIGQATENCSLVYLTFLTTEHVLNFITWTYLVNNQIQHDYEKQLASFPEVELKIKIRIWRKFRQDYRNTFSRDNDYNWMPSLSVSVKKRKTVSTLCQLEKLSTHFAEKVSLKRLKVVQFMFVFYEITTFITKCCNISF